jgi:putative hemolysin
VIAVKSLWARMVRGEAIDLRTEIIPALFIPESTPTLKLITLLQENRQHMALVIDEFAGIEGLVTLTDILEALVGSLPSIEDQPEDLDVVQREDGSWLVDGQFPTAMLKERFELETLPGDERGLFRTLGGFMMSNLGRIPRLGDYAEWAGYRFEVVDMDGHRIDKVLVQKRPTPDTPPNPPAEPSP